MTHDPQTGETMRELMDRLARAAGAEDFSSWDGDLGWLPEPRRAEALEGIAILESAITSSSEGAE